MGKQKKQVILENILVQDYAAEGKSLARADGKVIFIEGAVPGDLVDVLLHKNKADWAEGRVIKTHAYSPGRVTPFCTHFGVCGGCQWQMLPYDKQLFYKRNRLAITCPGSGKYYCPPYRPL
ncbi:MAG: TRAM domain-containing protein [Bacteroidota bacterium]